MQEVSKENQFILKIDMLGTIKEEVLNTFQDYEFVLDESLLQQLDTDSQTVFLYHIDQVINVFPLHGFRTTLKDFGEIYVFMIYADDVITIFTTNLEKEILELFDKIVKINSEQLNSIRELYQKLSKHEDEDGLLNEIMLVNNRLVNTQRELSKKNKELEIVNKKLEEVTYTDYLTKIGNRRKFFRDFCILTKKEKHQLIMLDFNNFKVINDELGHAEGDKLLQFFATEMNQLLDSVSSELYRLGGDEFAFLVNRKEPFVMQNIIDYMDLRIKKFHKDISLSFGSVDIPAGYCKAKKKIEDMMHLADNQMYKMKQLFYQNNPAIKQKR